MRTKGGNFIVHAVNIQVPPATPRFLAHLFLPEFLAVIGREYHFGGGSRTTHPLTHLDPIYYPIWWVMDPPNHPYSSICKWRSVSGVAGVQTHPPTRFRANTTARWWGPDAQTHHRPRRYPPHHISGNYSQHSKKLCYNHSRRWRR